MEVIVSEYLEGNVYTNGETERNDKDGEDAESVEDIKWSWYRHR